MKKNPTPKRVEAQQKRYEEKMAARTPPPWTVCKPDGSTFGVMFRRLGAVVQIMDPRTQRKIMFTDIEWDFFLSAVKSGAFDKTSEKEDPTAGPDEQASDILEAVQEMTI